MSVGREARDHWASQEATARDEDFSDDPDDAAEYAYTDFGYTDRVPRPYPTSGLAKALADAYDPLFFRVRNGMRTACADYPA